MMETYNTIKLYESYGEVMSYIHFFKSGKLTRCAASLILRNITTCKIQVSNFYFFYIPFINESMLKIKHQIKKGHAWLIQYHNTTIAL